MNPEHDVQDNDFQDLRRLLALKRYEQPPPRYFNDFSRQVIDRLRSSSRPVPLTLAGRWFGRQAPWLRGLTSVLEGRPLLAGGCGAVACGLLILGIVSSEQPVPDSSVSLPVMPGIAAVSQSAPQEHTQPFFGPPRSAQLTTDAGWAPALQTGDSLFDQIQKPHIQPVSFQP